MTNHVTPPQPLYAIMSAVTTTLCHNSYGNASTHNRSSYHPPTHTHIQLMSLHATTTVRMQSLHFTIYPPVKIELPCMLGETFCSVATDNTGRMESLTAVPLTVRVSLSLEFTPFSVQQVRGTFRGGGVTGQWKRSTQCWP